MTLQNSSPKEAKGSFDEASRIEDEQRLALEVYKLGSPRLNKLYEACLLKQSFEMEERQKALELERPKKVEDIADLKLNEAVREINPNLRPKDLLGPDRSELSKRAIHDATAEVMREESAELHKMRNTQLEEREEFVKSARDIVSAVKQDFNERTEGRGR
ncbi:MAG: hypothetical protein ACPGN3_12295 [Opitutales bacterium]